MAETLKNPPLLEAICQVRYEAKLWDMALPGLFYDDKTRASYPDRKDLKDLSIDIRSEEGRIVPTETPRIGFNSADAKSVVQMGPGFMSIHRLRPYVNWADMQMHTLEALGKLDSAFGERLKPEGYSLTLRYVNRFDHVNSRDELTQRLNIYPSTTVCSGSELNPYFMHVELPGPAENTVFLVETGTAAPARKAPYSIMLDLAVTQPPQALTPIKGVAEWLDLAHQAIEGKFLGCLTEHELQRISSSQQ